MTNPRLFPGFSIPWEPWWKLVSQDYVIPPLWSCKLTCPRAGDQNCYYISQLTLKQLTYCVYWPSPLFHAETPFPMCLIAQGLTNRPLRIWMLPASCCSMPFLALPSSPLSATMTTGLLTKSLLDLIHISTYFLPTPHGHLWFRTMDEITSYKVCKIS